MRNRDDYNQKALNRIESILEELEVEFEVKSNYIKFKCPIHGSEKITSGTIYLDTGLWQCHSDDCNSTHGNDLISLIQGTIQSGNFVDALLFIDRGHKVVLREKVQSTPINYQNEDILPEMIIPSRYYIDRGISREALLEYKVGDCAVGAWADKSIIPIYHSDENFMGFTARSHFSQCLKCEFYHSPYCVCVKKDDPYSVMHNRWTHKKGTQISKTFYGIDKCYGSKAVIVEGISCVWRLWENNILGLGCCGTSFGQSRVNLLKSKGINTLVLAMDSDEAGQKFKNDIIKKYFKDFSIHPINLPQKDITDMSNDEIQNTIKPIWDKL